MFGFLSVYRLFGVCLQYYVVCFLFFVLLAVLSGRFCSRSRVLPLRLSSLFFSSLFLGGRPGRGLLFLLRFLPCALRSRNLRRCRHVLACCALPPFPLCSFPPVSPPSPSSRPASPLSRCLSPLFPAVSLSLFSLFSLFSSLFFSFLIFSYLFFSFLLFSYLFFSLLLFSSLFFSLLLFSSLFFSFFSVCLSLFLSFSPLHARVSLCVCAVSRTGDEECT